MNSSVGNHSQGVEAEDGEPNFTVYNMWIHDNPQPGLWFLWDIAGSQVYNNVLSDNNGPNFNVQMATVTAAQIPFVLPGIRVSTIRIDCSLSSIACILRLRAQQWPVPLRSSWAKSSSKITANQRNGSGTIGNTLTSGTVTQITNTQMTSSLATSQGYTSAMKYAPISGAGATVVRVTRLGFFVLCTLPQLCMDASGAPWFGGSGKHCHPPAPGIPAPTNFPGGTTGPPTATVTAPSNGATISGSSVSLRPPARRKAPPLA